MQASMMVVGWTVVEVEWVIAVALDGCETGASWWWVDFEAVLHSSKTVVVVIIMYNTRYAVTLYLEFNYFYSRDNLLLLFFSFFFFVFFIYFLFFEQFVPHVLTILTHF